MQKQSSKSSASLKDLKLRTYTEAQKLQFGQSRSQIQGQGIEFYDLKEYTETDDIKHIDWQASSRKQKLYIKRYTAEQDTQFLIALDISASQDCGSYGEQKIIRAKESALLLARVAWKQNYKLGLCMFTDKIEHYTPPQKTHTQELKIQHTLFTHKPHATGTSIQKACHFLTQALKRRSLICLISDFIDTEYTKELTILSRRHDIFAIRIEDSFEKEAPQVKYLRIQDNETKEEAIIRSGDPHFRRKYRAQAQEHRALFHKACKTARVKYFESQTNRAYIKQLAQFLKKRIHKRP